VTALVTLSAQALYIACNLIAAVVLLFASLCFACMAVEKAGQIIRKVKL